MITLRLLLAARAGRGDALAAALEDEGHRAETQLGADARVVVLRRLADDFFAAQYPGRRAFDAVLAVDAGDPDPGTARARLIDLCRGAGERLDKVVQADLSGALVAERRRVKGDEAAVRFLYLMRHKAGQTTESFQEHWGGAHADFGRRTEGITGYDQLHVDPQASRAAARIAGFGVWRIDGVPELHMNSLDEFVKGAIGSSVGAEALEDERSFVDSANSVGFTCAVVPARAGRGG